MRQRKTQPRQTQDTTQERFESLARHMDVIAHLLTMLLADKKPLPSVTSRILLLNDMGLSPTDIGRVVGKRVNYVGSVLSQKGKSNKRSKQSDG